MSDETKNLIDLALQKNAVQFKSDFEKALNAHVNDAVNQVKTEISSNIANPQVSKPREQT